MPYEPEDREVYERNSTHAVANAVAAERARCLKIAEDAALEIADGEGEIYVAKKIAKAIRNF